MIHNILLPLRRPPLSHLPLIAALGLGMTAPAAASLIEVRIENLAPQGGLFLTPFWVGFHDGGFDLYDPGEPLGSAGLAQGMESLVEDGDTGPVSADFATAPGGQVDAIIAAPQGFGGAPVFDPGDVATMTFDLAGTPGTFFSYASMVIPSNDAFVANGNPMTLSVYDALGGFTPLDIIIFGSDILDGGTEENTEMNAAFINQTAPNTGSNQNGTVVSHPGFIGSVGNPGGTPIILGGVSTATGSPLNPEVADFTANPDSFRVARITVTQVPQPATLALLGLGIAGLMVVQRRRWG